MVFEDIQYQQNIMTFKILAMLLGICETCARKAGIDFRLKDGLPETACLLSETTDQIEIEGFREGEP